MRTRAILPDVADILVEVQQAQQVAAAAETQAADATTMAHGAATGLTSLEQLAAELARAIPAADQVHAKLQDQIDALTRRTTTMQTKRTQLAAQVLLGGTGTVAFTWDTPFPDTAYTAVLVAPLPITDVTPTLTKTGVTFTYKASALIALGTTMQALAIR